ncbi:MAG: VWA domain-containing protein [Acidobacteriota bacterium]|nr:VWA domain-containing protein [Blastocatellia bacterium]MDW8412288.1 VWA domain-containing protein [Acidobacteriota bacterium]
MKAQKLTVIVVAFFLVTAKVYAQEGERGSELPVIRTGTNLVTLNVTVTDQYGRYVTGLSKQHFEVYDDKVPQKIEFFSSADAPVSMGIIFDVSGSMKGRIDRSHVALKRFFEVGHEKDEYFLVCFSSTAKLTQDFTNDSAKIANSLMMIEPKGQTALYDAVYIGVEKVRRGRHPRKAILIISDGQDNNSRYSFKELKQLVKESDVQIYAIGITNVFSSRELDIDGQIILEEISRLTGGRAFFPANDAELSEIITRIGLELRHQYSIGYEPTGVTADGKWHKIKVKLNAPKGLPPMTVRTREGYYARRGSD